MGCLLTPNSTERSADPSTIPSRLHYLEELVEKGNVSDLSAKVERLYWLTFFGAHEAGELYDSDNENILEKSPNNFNLFECLYGHQNLSPADFAEIAASPFYYQVFGDIPPSSRGSFGTIYSEILSLKSRSDDVENDITDIQNLSLDSRMNDAENDIADIKTRLTDAENDIISLKNRVTALENA